MASCEEWREPSTEGLAPEVTWSSPARGGSPLENGSQGLCMDAAGTARFIEGPGNATARTGPSRKNSCLKKPAKNFYSSCEQKAGVAVFKVLFFLKLLITANQ